MSSILCFRVSDFFIFSGWNTVASLRGFFKGPGRECVVSSELCMLVGVYVHKEVLCLGMKPRLVTLLITLLAPSLQATR